MRNGIGFSYDTSHVNNLVHVSVDKFNSMSLILRQITVKKSHKYKILPKGDE